MGSTVPLGTVSLVIPSPLKRGDGILLFPGFIYTIIIPSPRRGWDLVLPWFHVHYYYYPIPQKGMGSCSSLVSCTLLLSHPPEGDGILFFPGFMYTIIIIIPSPIRGWDLVLPWFHVHYCYYPIPQKGMGSCSSLVSCTLLLFFFFLS